MRIIEIRLDEDMEKKIQEFADTHTGGCIEEMAEDMLLKQVDDVRWQMKHEEAKT